MAFPVELLADNMDHGGLALVRRLIHGFGPQRQGDAHQQHAFDQRHCAFEVTRRVTPDAVVIGFGIARTPEPNERIDEIGQPAHE